LGKAGFGILYLLFFWTFIPAIIALVEGIIYLVQDDATFGQKQGVNVA
jgi:TM2 domain-containing membrane protein YozV